MSMVDSVTNALAWIAAVPYSYCMKSFTLDIGTFKPLNCGVCSDKEVPFFVKVSALSCECSEF